MNEASKTVVVTGASRGLGLGIAHRLAGSGFKVIGVARSASDEFAKLQADSELGPRIALVQADLAKTEDIYALCRTLQQQHGPIYGLVNNAAIGLDGLLATQHERDIDAMVRVNLTAPILLAKYLSRSMLLQRQGRIVNISSIVADTGFSGLAVYGATKAALTGFSRSLARELARAGITVNCVCPGYMETAMTTGLDPSKLDAIRRRSPFGKFVSPSDVAGAVAYLLHDDAALVTGTSITVDAGSTA